MTPLPSSFQGAETLLMPLHTRPPAAPLHLVVTRRWIRSVNPESTASLAVSEFRPVEVSATRWELRVGGGKLVEVWGNSWRVDLQISQPWVLLTGHAIALFQCVVYFLSLTQIGGPSTLSSGDPSHPPGLCGHCHHLPAQIEQCCQK